MVVKERLQELGLPVLRAHQVESCQQWRQELAEYWSEDVAEKVGGGYHLLVCLPQEAVAFYRTIAKVSDRQVPQKSAIDVNVFIRRWKYVLSIPFSM